MNTKFVQTSSNSIAPIVTLIKKKRKVGKPKVLMDKTDMTCHDMTWFIKTNRLHVYMRIYVVIGQKSGINVQTSPRKSLAPILS